MPAVYAKTIDAAIAELAAIGYVLTAVQPTFNAPSRRLVRMRNEEKDNTVLISRRDGTVYLNPSQETPAS